MNFNEKVNVNKPMAKKNIGLRFIYIIQLSYPAMRRSTVGFWPVIHKLNERIYVKSAGVLFYADVLELRCTSFDSMLCI